MPTYQVIANNIGIVYDGGSYDSANDAFHIYRKQSIDGIGRAAGEDVVMLKHGEIIREYISAAE